MDENTNKSSGRSIWEKCAGRKTTCTLFIWHCHRNSVLVWLLWSSRSSIYELSNSDWLSGKKIFLSHSIPISLDVQPFSDVVITQSSISPALNQENWGCLSLKIIKSLTNWSVALTVSRIETQSLFSGASIWAVFQLDVASTLAFEQISCAIPYSSIFQIFLMGMLFSVQTHSNRLKNFWIFSGWVSWIHLTSTLLPIQEVILEFYFRNLAVHSFPSRTVFLFIFSIQTTISQRHICDGECALESSSNIHSTRNSSCSELSCCWCWLLTCLPVASAIHIQRVDQGML